MDERLWSLPGPRRFLNLVAEESDQGRDVAVVLPDHMLQDEVLVDGFIESCARGPLAHREVQRVTLRSEHPSTAFSVGESFGLDDPPVVVRELVSHKELVGSTAILAITDLPRARRADVSAFLRKVSECSRSLSPDKRLRFIAVVGHDERPIFLGGDDSDVTMTSIWWWNRLARWDSLAYLSASQTRTSLSSPLLADIRLETIVELSKWNLDLGERLLADWSGKPDELASHLAQGIEGADLVIRQFAPRPNDAVLEHWDQNLIDGWHHEVSVLPMTTNAHNLADNAVWSAQARVLLPWIETRRPLLHAAIESEIGSRRFRQALAEIEGRYSEKFVEIGHLKLIATRELTAGSKLRNASTAMHKLRNDLAHLTSVPELRIEQMLIACTCLT